MRGVLESRRGFRVDTVRLLCEVSTDTIYFVVFGRFWRVDLRLHFYLFKVVYGTFRGINIFKVLVHRLCIILKKYQTVKENLFLFRDQWK